MIQELALHKEVNTLEKLRHLRMINHRNIQQTIIRHCIRSLSVTRCITDTHGHYPALDDIRIDFNMHFIVKTLKNHQDERAQERQRTGAKHVMRFPSQVHDGSNQSNINAVKEIASAFLPFLIRITDASKIYLSDSSCFKRCHRFFNIAVTESPEMSKIIHQSVRNYTQRHLITLLCIYLHQTIDGIVERRISAHNNYRLIAIVDKHLNQSLYAFLIFTLHKVIIYILCLEHLFYLFPALIASPATSWAVKQSPFILVYHCLFFVI